MEIIAMYAGSFDPITKGHLNIIERACKMYDIVIMVVMTNSNKKETLFTAAERVELIRKSTLHLKNIIVAYQENSLVAVLAKELNATVLIKGLRAVTDFEKEFQQALTNKKLNPELETVFFSCDLEYMYLSSSMVKEVCRLGGEVKDFLPSQIYEDVVRRINKVKEKNNG